MAERVVVGNTLNTVNGTAVIMVEEVTDTVMVMDISTKNESENIMDITLKVQFYEITRIICG